MKKERMTIEELTELLKQNPDGVELVCDDKFYSDSLKRVVVKFIHKNEVVVIDSNNRIDYIATHLHHYPSQKPQRELIELFECLDISGTVRYCDKDGKFPYSTKKEMWGNPKLCELRKNSIIKGGRKLYLDAVTYELVQDGE